MGRQVQAELEDLALAGCDVFVEYAVEGEGGDRGVRRYAVVDLPDGSRITSYLGDVLVFDCRNRQSANYWALERLIDLGVPFRWS